MVRPSGSRTSTMPDSKPCGTSSGRELVGAAGAAVVAPLVVAVVVAAVGAHHRRTDRRRAHNAAVGPARACRQAERHRREHRDRRAALAVATATFASMAGTCDSCGFDASELWAVHRVVRDAGGLGHARLGQGARRRGALVLRLPQPLSARTRGAVLSCGQRWPPSGAVRSRWCHEHAGAHLHQVGRELVTPATELGQLLLRGDATTERRQPGTEHVRDVHHVASSQMGQAVVVASPTALAARTSSGWASQTWWRARRPLRYSEISALRARR